MPKCGHCVFMQLCVSVPVSYLRDHGKSQDEEGDAADQSEERLVFPQVFGELVRNRGHDGLNGGKLEKKDEWEEEGGKMSWRQKEKIRKEGREDGIREEKVYFYCFIH